MSIDHIYFTADKNRLLKTVQGFTQEPLVKAWCKNAFNSYMAIENPMGLEDSFTESLRKNITKGCCVLEDAYGVLAAIYRFRFGNNQLSFMWDGRTHMEFYDEEWRETFDVWTKRLSRKPEVYRAIIKAAISDSQMNNEFLKASIKRAILKEFNVKLSRAQRIEQLAISA